MAVVIKNTPYTEDVFEMKVSWEGETPLPGQFFMVRAWDLDPLLSRPISVFDYKKGTVTFLYQVVGKGTRILSELKFGDDIEIQGPYGHGFPVEDEDISVIGGGIGIPPLYYLIKEHKKQFPDRKRVAYLGYREETFAQKYFQDIADKVVINVGGLITDDLVGNPEGSAMVCGPEPMMEAVYRLQNENFRNIYVSIEKRMACGVGACLGCTCETHSGQKRACKDGPVFNGKELY